MRGLMLALLMVLVGTALATGGLALGQVTPPGAELVVLGSGGPRMAGRAASSNVVPEGKARMPNLTRLAGGADLLVFNCAVLDPPGSPAELYTRHTAPRQIGEVAHRAGVKRLLLTHVAPLVERSPDEVLASVRAGLVGPVEIARDRMRLPLAPP